MQKVEIQEDRTKIFRPSPRRPYGRPPAHHLYQLLKSQAEKYPAAPAILGSDRSPLTYHRLLSETEKTVRALRSYDLGRNDRVAIVLPNGPEMAVSFVAVACAVACAPLNPAYTAEEFRFYLGDLHARALLLAAGMDSPARAVATALGIPVIELTADLHGNAGMFTLAGKSCEPSHDICFSEPDDIALVLHTSGTTSRPKMVPLTHANICISGHNTATALELTERDRCLNVMPLFHIHGLIGALVSSLMAGASVVCTPGFAPEKFFGWLEAFSPTWYTAVPTIHQAILASAPANQEIIRRRPLRFIRSCSAALPPRLMQDLQDAFQTQVIESYGMTEASHQMASNPLAPRPRKAGCVGIAAGPDIAIMSDGGNLLPVGETGEVVIRGANVTAGYENNPDANARSFTNGWFRTGDQGRFDEDGYLFLTGRLKEIIVRGGEKISPREVDDVLMQHPALAQALTFAVPHPTLDEDIGAVVVLREGHRVTENDIRDFAASRLAEFKVPRHVLILSEIPKGPTGKPQRIGLADRLADKLALKQQENFVSPHTALEKALAEIWRSVLKVDRVGIRDDFYALGGDSLAGMMLLLAIAERFKVEIAIEGFLKAPTISTLARLLGQAEPSLPSSRAEPHQGSPRQIRDSIVTGAKNRILQMVALYIPGYKTTRVWLHRLRGVSIGTNVSVGLSVLIETAYPRLVSIGNNVSVGMRAIIIGHLRDSTTRARLNNQPTVRIEDDVYIGPGVIILPNVTIGRGAVIAAGSVVSRSIPPQTLARGNPAEPIAHCGVSLGGGVSYEQFLRHLRPIPVHGTPTSPQIDTRHLPS